MKRRGGLLANMGHWSASSIGRVTIAFFLGVIAAFGQAPYEQPLIMVLALSFGFQLFRGQRRAVDGALTGWCFGVGYFGVALFWIVEPFQIDPERHGWMAPFALVLMSMGLALFWGGAFWVARLISLRTWPLAVTWTLAEVLRAYVFTGFPWASPPQALIDGTAGQGLAFVGPHGMMLCLMSLAWALSFAARIGGGKAERFGQIGLLLAVAILMYLPPLSPSVSLTGHWVRLVQPNAAQDLKWKPEFAQSFFETQLKFTAALPTGANPVPSLTVWPETAIPWTLEVAKPALVQIASAAKGTPVALGLLRREGQTLFNALAVLDADGVAAQIYDKYHLVPFGEYIPFGNTLSKFGITGLAQTSGIGFASGLGPKLLDFGELGRGLALICYEVVFAHGVNQITERPDFLLQITNDAWFGHNAGPQQHLAQARMRAIEQGLPLMRAANTGVSAMIDPHGRIIASLPVGVAGFLDAPLPAPINKTLYNRTGDAPIFIILALGLLLAWSGRTGRG